MDRFNTFKLFIETNRNKIIIILVFLITIIASTIFFLNVDRTVNVKTDSKVFANLNLKNDNSLKKTDKDDDKEYYFIDIKGEVHVPGVYSLEKGKRVIDAINIAGGLTENADTSILNQSIKLTDQMVIIIYSKESINNINETKEKDLKKQELCREVVKNDVCIYNNKETIVVPSLNEEKNDTLSNKEEINNGLININEASLEILKTLPGIGDIIAGRIIAYREEFGNFNSIEDIKKVKGIGENLFAKIKDNITI